MYDYEENPEFSNTIKKARTFMEREYEKLLHTNPTWAIFALKNFWWTDRQEVDTTMKFSWSLDVNTIWEKPMKDLENLRKELIK